MGYPRQFDVSSFDLARVLGVLTIVTKTKTFTILANQRALLVSRNAEKNLKNHSQNESVRHLIVFPKICFVLIVTFV